MISKIEVERFTLSSSKPFDQVVAALNSAVGHPDMAEFWKSTHRAQSDAELQNTIEKGLGRTGLMLFVEFDHGAIVRKGTGGATPRMIRFVIGNPLIMREMAKHVPDAGSYAPVTILIEERTDGVHLAYDRMASFFDPSRNEEALKVARDLDSEVESLGRPQPRSLAGMSYSEDASCTIMQTCKTTITRVTDSHTVTLTPTLPESPRAATFCGS